jgi:hypothetical protein
MKIATYINAPYIGTNKVLKETLVKNGMYEVEDSHRNDGHKIQINGQWIMDSNFKIETLSEPEYKRLNEAKRKNRRIIK